MADLAALDKIRSLKSRIRKLESRNTELNKEIRKVYDCDESVGEGLKGVQRKVDDFRSEVESMTRRLRKECGFGEEYLHRIDKVLSGKEIGSINEHLRKLRGKLSLKCENHEEEIRTNNRLIWQLEEEIRVLEQAAFSEGE